MHETCLIIVDIVSGSRWQLNGPVASAVVPPCLVLAERSRDEPNFGVGALQVRIEVRPPVRIGAGEKVFVADLDVVDDIWLWVTIFSSLRSPPCLSAGFCGVVFPEQLTWK